MEWRETAWVESILNRVSRACQPIVGSGDREGHIKVEAQVVIPFTERGDSRSSCVGGKVSPVSTVEFEVFTGHPGGDVK